MPLTLRTVNTRNVVTAISIGAITLPMLARVFGVGQHDGRLLTAVGTLAAAGKLEIEKNDLHTLHLTGGPR
jgi:hypothetical protein